MQTIDFITTQNSTFHKAKRSMQWGVSAMPLCLVMAFIALGISQSLLFVSFVGYIASLLCYVFGTYLFSRLCHSRLLVLNLIKIGSFIVFVGCVGLLIAQFESDVFGLVFVLLVCCGYGFMFITLDRKISQELFYKTGVRYFRIAFWVRLFSLVMLIIIGLVMAFGIATGVDLQAVLVMMNTHDGLMLFMQNNPLIFTLYCVVVVGIIVSLLTSLFLYAVAYYKIQQAVLMPQNTACVGICGCLR